MPNPLSTELKVKTVKKQAYKTHEHTESKKTPY